MKYLIFIILLLTAPVMLLAQQEVRDQADDIFQQLMGQDAPSREEGEAEPTQTAEAPQVEAEAEPENSQQPANSENEVTQEQDSITPLQLQEMLRASIKQEIKIPDEAQRQFNDKQLSQKVKEFLKLSLSERLIDVVVDTRYIVQLVPIVKKSSQLQKIKLPGFENYVWTPAFKNHNLSFSYQTRPYRTYFILLNGPKTLVNYDLVQKRIVEIDPTTDWENRDLLRVINVSYETPESSPLQIAQQKQTQQEEIPQIEPKEAVPAPLSLEEQLEQEKQFSKHLLSARDEFFKDNLDAALDNLIEAIKFNPKSAQAYEMLGSVYYRLDWKEKALHYWGKSLELYPDNKTLQRYYDNLRQ